MNNLRVFDKSIYNDLLQNKENNCSKYLKTESFVFEKYNLDQNDYIPRFKLKTPTENQNFGLDNSITLFEYLKDIDMSIVIDQRFWTTLSHTYYYDYIRARMPFPGKKNNETLSDYRARLDRYVNDHFFQNGEQRRSRHTLAGLWWRAFLTYDDKLHNPFEYTEKLYSFTDSDLLNSVVENTLFLSYPDLAKAFIDVLLEIDYGKIEVVSRKFNREIAALINLEGSIRLYSTFTYDYFYEMINEIVEVILDDL